MQRFLADFPFLVKIPAWLFLQLVGRTNRLCPSGTDYREVLQQNESPHVFALWHNQLLLPIYHFHPFRLSAIISHSRDGELITRAIQPFGIHVCRGSASRGGAGALLGLLHELKRGRNAVVTPDGPRGPRGQVQAGVITLARLSGVPITPVAFNCTRNIRLRSWDRFMVPLPFGCIRYCVGDPVSVPRDADPDVLKERRNRLQFEMDRLNGMIRLQVGDREDAS